MSCRYNIYIYTHYWRILLSSQRKLTWVGLESTTTEFRSDATTDGAIKPLVQFKLRANFVQLLQFQCLFSVRFHFGYCLRQSPCFFWLKYFGGNYMSVVKRTDTYGIYNWRILWSSYRKLAWIGFEPMMSEFCDWGIR